MRTETLATTEKDATPETPEQPEATPDTQTRRNVFEVTIGAFETNQTNGYTQHTAPVLLAWGDVRNRIDDIEIIESPGSDPKNPGTHLSCKAFIAHCGQELAAEGHFIPHENHRPPREVRQELIAGFKQRVQQHYGNYSGN